MKDTATSRRVQRGIVLAASGAAEAHSDQYRVNGRGGTRTSWRMVRLTQSDGTTHQVLVPPGFVVWTGGADEE